MAVPDWSRPIVVALLVAGGAVAALWGCSSPRACDGPDDCFRGQTCRGGECRSGAPVSVGSGDADGADRRETADGSGGADVRDCSAPGVQCDGGGTCRDRADVGPERCNGRDDDCDGVVDEGCPCIYDPSDPNNIDDEPGAPCHETSNACGVCKDQRIDENGLCTKPDAYESEESSCSDGLDNDCDSFVDATGDNKDFDCP